MFLIRKLLITESSKVTPIVFNDPDGSKRFIENECPICLDKLTGNKAKLPCGHYFHTNCILDWINKKHMTCPVCRIKLTWYKDEKKL